MLLHDNLISIGASKYLLRQREMGGNPMRSRHCEGKHKLPSQETSQCDKLLHLVTNDDYVWLAKTIAKVLS